MGRHGRSRRPGAGDQPATGPPVSDRPVPPRTMTRRPRRATTAHEYAREWLRTAILEGAFPAGTRLRQSELATQLGVSTTPIREALRDLAAEHLLVMHPHHGAIVRALDLGEVREIYELRITLEPILARRLIDTLDDQTLDEARALWHRMLPERDVAAWSQYNRDFHALLSSPEDHSRLGVILTGLRDNATAYVDMSLRARAGLMDQANAEHGEFIELFAARDVEGVVDLTRRHLHATLDAIEHAHGAADRDDTSAHAGAAEPAGTQSSLPEPDASSQP